MGCGLRPYVTNYTLFPEHIGRNPDRPKYIPGFSCFLIASFEREPLTKKGKSILLRSYALNLGLRVRARTLQMDDRL